MLFLLLAGAVKAQDSSARLNFFSPSDTLNKWRFWGSASLGAATYTGVMIGLNEVWYAEFPRSSFHFFNDWEEWEKMDKAGHLFTAYMESNWIYQGARWTGLEERKSIWLGVAMGTLFQASIETLDGFSEEWGFSMGDIGFNTLGCALFAGQQLSWGEQRILMKVSSTRPSYPDVWINSVEGNARFNLRDRADQLYGTAFAEAFLKDYNAQTIWASVNLTAFMNTKHRAIPPWLNVAFGYGAGNMFGGFRNEWTNEAGDRFVLDSDAYPRYRQYYLSLDIDLTRIKTRSPFLKTLFNLFNVIKIPAPTLEYNTLGQFKFHPIYF